MHPMFVAMVKQVTCVEHHGAHLLCSYHAVSGVWLLLDVLTKVRNCAQQQIPSASGNGLIRGPSLLSCRVEVSLVLIVPHIASNHFVHTLSCFQVWVISLLTVGRW